MLERKRLRRPPGPEGARRFACSGDPEAFRRLAGRFLQMPLGAVELVDPVADGPSAAPGGRPGGA